MGFNTSLIVLNDALDQIEKDATFGKHVAEAIRHLQVTHGEAVDIASGNHVNAAAAIESHHADFTSVVAFGGNCATVLGDHWGYRHNDREVQVHILKELADKMGYKLVKKSKPKDMGVV